MRSLLQSIPIDPCSFGELLDAAEEHPGLIMTCDRGVAAGLDRHKHAGRWRRRAAQALLTLGAYALAQQEAVAAGGGTCDLLRFLGSGDPRVLLPARTVATTESHGTIEQERARVFRVPEAVDASGLAGMLAHIRIGTAVALAPRLHFLDNTQGPTGRIVVGYLGPHLRGTRNG